MSELYHWGITGMKWGFRRFQNEDGSLTSAGRERYGVGAERASKKHSKAGMVGLEAKYQAKRAVKSVKKTASELDEARINNARRRVSALVDKRDRIQEKAFLKEQEKALKKDMKKVKKDAEKEAKGKFSIKKIKDLSDEEISARINRLKREGELLNLEASRNMSPGMKAFADAISGAATEATKGLAKDAVTALGSKFLKDIGLDLNDKSIKEASDAASLIRKQLDQMKAQDEYNDYVLTRKATTDAERLRGARLSEKAKRYQNMQNIANARKAIEGDPDDELAREAKRWQNAQTIANAKRSLEPKESAEDAGKRQTQRINERKEMERRVKAYRKNDVPFEEIARRLGITIDQAKDLNYE